MTLVGFKSKNHPQQVRKRGADDGVDERITPPEIWNPLNEEFRFTVDVAASHKNRKCERFYDLSLDGLAQSWKGERVWCNPPYSGCAEWVRKASSEVRSGDCHLAVLLLPSNRTEQTWWHAYIEPYRELRDGKVRTRFLRGRPRFGWPEGRVVPPKGDRPPFGLVVVVLSR